jgi:hypothetical protein
MRLPVEICEHVLRYCEFSTLFAAMRVDKNFYFAVKRLFPERKRILRKTIRSWRNKIIRHGPRRWRCRAMEDESRALWFAQLLSLRTNTIPKYFSRTMINDYRYLCVFLSETSFRGRIPNIEIIVCMLRNLDVPIPPNFRRVDVRWPLKDAKEFAEHWQNAAKILWWCPTIHRRPEIATIFE